MSVIITYALGGSLGNQSLIAAWAALILSLPVYYLLYVYLDQVVPNTFGISKSCCFCFKKRRAAANDIRDTLKNSKIQELDESRGKLEVDHHLTEDNEVPFLINNNVRLFLMMKSNRILSNCKTSRKSSAPSRQSTLWPFPSRKMKFSACWGTTALERPLCSTWSPESLSPLEEMLWVTIQFLICYSLWK